MIRRRIKASTPFNRASPVRIGTRSTDNSSVPSATPRFHWSSGRPRQPRIRSSARIIRAGPKRGISNKAVERPMRSPAELPWSSPGRFRRADRSHPPRPACRKTQQSAEDGDGAPSSMPSMRAPPRSGLGLPAIQRYALGCARSPSMVRAAGTGKAHGDRYGMQRRCPCPACGQGGCRPPFRRWPSAPCLDYTETQCKFLLARNRLTRTPLARLQSVDIRFLDLTVEGAEVWRIWSHGVY